ncbi:N-acetyltransferase [Trypanosoma rangeli]|uniref:N-acetyltransferase n=1 Tax=Trypanosoma rangeli TaxID=5698 RepID=A0A422NDM9_TRYRA|nr:N-acetyltransferase [Trypanosoma rangeli]RNF03546.1 N-acetyltransferase [Trypanosoma rangeli]|eukprot:RNF03546.1 N-acetyltransferase [Trypanosoma rangeli]
MNNERVLVSGSRLRLVPYLAHHVPRYYEWMGDSELMQCTASERLTLEEEYDNQRDWLHAEDKLTFIVLAPLSRIVKKAPRKVIGNAALGKCTAVKDSMDDADVGAGGTSGGNKIAREDAGADASRDGVGPKVSGISTPFVTACLTHTGSTCSLACVDCEVEGRNSETYVMVGDCNLFRLGSNSVEQVEGEEGGGCSFGRTRRVV